MSPAEVANAKLKLYNDILASKNVDNAVKEYVKIEKEHYTKKLKQLNEQKYIENNNSA